MNGLSDSDVRGVVLDLDGTVYDSAGLIQGAGGAVETLRSAGLRVMFATNTTRQPRSALVERLRRLGIQVTADDVVTAPRAAATWLRENGVSTVALCLPDETATEFGEFRIDDEHPAAVVVGDLGLAWTYDRLNRAFRHVMAGAELVAVQKNRYWRTSDGLTLDAGPFVAALEYATGKNAVTVGKPSTTFFEAAARSLDLPAAQIVMVGDDVISDVQGAQRSGLSAVLVKTGKFRPDDLKSSVRPDAMIDSVADLPALLLDRHRA